MKIGLLGDTHGDSGWMQYCVGMFERRGISTVIQLGDFGIWPGKKPRAQFDALNEAIKAAGQTWYVVPGNHEDYNQIDALEPREDGLLEFRSHILLYPRGYRWEMGGMSFVALGGAGSVDRRRRLDDRRFKTWWPQEAITVEDVEKTIAGGYADVMVGHDAPDNVAGIERRIQNNSWIDPADLIYAEGVRLLMTQAFHGVAPEFFFHGHYHFKVNEEKVVSRNGEMGYTRIMGFGCNPSPYSDDWRFAAGALDTDTRTAEIFDLKADFHQYRYARGEGNGA